MARIDLHKLALRLKVVELLKSHTQQRRLHEAHRLWRTLIQAN